MSQKNIILDLKTRKTFYVAKIKAPVFIDCSQGATFLIFVSDKGEEQLQIAPMDNKELGD